MMRLFKTLMTVCIVAGAASGAFACFFISDCPPGYKCVTAAGQWDGKCEEITEQPVINATVQAPALDMPCAYNSDCKTGYLCVRIPGTPNGLCKQDPNVSTDLAQQKPCTFPSDCKAGWQCIKQGNSSTGYCKEEFFGTTDDKDLRPRFQTTADMKKCLMDGDCGIREKCIQPVGSVFGYCEDKGVAAMQTTTQTNTQIPTTTTNMDSYVPNLF